MRAKFKKAVVVVVWAMATLTVLAAVSAFGLHEWLLNSPKAGQQIVQKVEQISHFRFGFTKVDARLGWFGPEIVFTDAKVFAPQSDVPMITARSGRVGFDLWRSIRTMRISSGRVVLEGAEVYVDITDQGVTLRGQGDWGKEANFRIADLPVGHIKIQSARLTVQDHRQNGAPWTVDQVGLEIERDPSELQFGAAVHLSDRISADISLDGWLRGDLEQLEQVEWSAEGHWNHALLGGWSALLPAWVHLPKGGQGQWGFKAQGTGLNLTHLVSQLDLKNIVTDSKLNVNAIAGKIEFERKSNSIEIHGNNLTVDTDHEHWRQGQVSIALQLLDDGSLSSLKVQSPQLSLNSIRVLAELMPEHPAREWLVGLQPVGQISQMNIVFRRQATQGFSAQGSASVHQVGWQAYESVPGISNLEALVEFDGDHGRISLHSKDLKVDLARALPEPFVINEVNADATVDLSPMGWSISVPKFTVHSVDGEATGLVHLWLPAQSELSPVVLLDAQVKNVDARHVVNYLPLKRFPSVAQKWLTSAFLQGRATHARIQLSGQLAQFPFRDGGGLFRASADIAGLKMHYADTFADLEDASGSAVFENQGFHADLKSGRIGGLSVFGLSGGMDDFKLGQLLIRGEATGDLKAALSYVQASLVGPKLGYEFMHLAGQGQMSAKVNLDFPFRQFANRVVTIDATVKSGRLRAPYWDEDIKDLNGSFTIRNFEFKTKDLSATMLGGPMHVSATTEASKHGLSGQHDLTIEASGHAQGERLATMLGFSDARIMSGGFDWNLRLNAPRIESRGKPVYDEENQVYRDAEWQIRFLPLTVHLESDLQGLVLNLPKPIDKTADARRPLKVDVVIDPKDLPTSRPRDTQAIPTALARVALGFDNAMLQWSFADGPHFDRGRVRLGGAVTEFGQVQGLSLEGHTPALDLSSWLSLPLKGGNNARVSEILRSGNLDVDRLEFLGFGFPGMHLTLSSDAKSWITEVDGTAAQGKIVVPFTLPESGVVSIDLSRLAADGYLDTPESAEAADIKPQAALRDPLSLPAIRIEVREVMFQKRQFGSFSAVVERSKEGLILKESLLKGHAFEGSATGNWLSKNGQSHVELNYSLDSRDVQETLTDWGFDPVVAAKSGKLSGEFSWNEGLTAGILGRVSGHSKLQIEKGQLLSVHPGAYKVLGLLSLSTLPKRLLLDFRDLTDTGLAFETVKGDFDFSNGNATTNNLLLKGPAAEIAIVGRTGILARDYDQTARVSGKVQTPLAAAGGVLAGPAVGAAVLLFSNVFKGGLGGLNASYYHIGGSWDNPKIDHLGSVKPKSSDTEPSP